MDASRREGLAGAVVGVGHLLLAAGFVAMVVAIAAIGPRAGEVRAADPDGLRTGVNNTHDLLTRFLAPLRQASTSAVLARLALPAAAPGGPVLEVPALADPVTLDDGTTLGSGTLWLRFPYLDPYGLPLVPAASADDVARFCGLPAGALADCASLELAGGRRLVSLGLGLRRAALEEQERRFAALKARERLAERVLLGGFLTMVLGVLLTREGWVSTLLVIAIGGIMWATGAPNYGSCYRMVSRSDWERLTPVEREELRRRGREYVAGERAQGRLDAATADLLERTLLRPGQLRVGRMPGEEP